ncbi:hypothetical protein A9Q81_27580 [Gammaproteobacteria bacterium 42_54_T18]|nr:hypothetical protein A9Q81_27580 [Gammaproteobacteria bacterium 42_54_T18]
MGKLTNKRALITGASRGIGRAMAQRLATENASLILIGRDTKQLDETAKLCNESGAAKVSCFELDLQDNYAIDKLCQSLLDDGGIDLLVNNAGNFTKGHALDGDADAWTQSMQLNLLVPMRLTRWFAPYMKDKESGIIINLGSVAAIEGMSSVGAYAATKHGLRGWSLSCYQQLREFGIKVVLINPAFVDTDMTAEVSINKELMLRPEDIAEAMMLAINSSDSCCPEEITLRLTKK